MTGNNVKLYLSRPKIILKLVGVWWPLKKIPFAHKIYMLFVLFTQFSFLLFEIIYIVDVWGDIEAVSEASFLLFTQASACFKTTVFLVNKKELGDLLEFMECKTFAPHSKEHERLLLAQSIKIKRLCLFFLTSACTTCTLWGVAPLPDENRAFPFKIWMPVTPQDSPNYEIGYTYQMISIYISALLFIAVDSVALCMIMFGCAQIEIIMDKLQQVQKVPKSAKLKLSEREKRLTTNNKLFTECVKQHQAVIRFIEEVENTYHTNIFFQLSGSVLIICIIGLRISIVAKDSLQFYSMVNYMVTMLSQLLLYCWCGNELTIRSQKLRDLIYLTPWYEQDIKFRRSMWITMERMKRPIIFKAGHYISLSRPTFVSILRSSYSYFAVLNQTNNKNK